HVTGVQTCALPICPIAPIEPRFLRVDLATPESTTPARPCQPHPQNVAQVTPPSTGPPPRKCKSVKLHTPSGFTLHPLFCNPILHNCVTLWFTEAYLR